MGWRFKCRKHEIYLLYVSQSDRLETVTFYPPSTPPISQVDVHKFGLTYKEKVGENTVIKSTSLSQKVPVQSRVGKQF